MPKSSVDPLVSRNIREILKQRGRSAYTIAKALGHSPNRLYRVGNGESGVLMPTLRELAAPLSRLMDDYRVLLFLTNNRTEQGCGNYRLEILYHPCPRRASAYLYIGFSRTRYYPQADEGRYAMIPEFTVRLDQGQPRWEKLSQAEPHPVSRDFLEMEGAEPTCCAVVGNVQDGLELGWARSCTALVDRGRTSPIGGRTFLLPHTRVG